MFRRGEPTEAKIKTWNCELVTHCERYGYNK